MYPSKSYRLKVAENFAGVLKFGGLTSREYGAKIAWDAKSPEERAQIIARGKKSLLVVRSTHNIGSEGVSISEGLSE